MKLNFQLNREKHRTEAAELLADYVLENWDKKQDITLIGYSHGGNVAIQAAKIIQAKIKEEYNKDIKVNIITVNTPSYTTDNEGTGIENPINNNAINDMIAIGTKDDDVAGAALRKILISDGNALGEDQKLPEGQHGTETTPRIRTIWIKSVNRVGGILNNHYLENVNYEQIHAAASGIDGFRLKSNKKNVQE